MQGIFNRIIVFNFLYYLLLFPFKRVKLKTNEPSFCFDAGLPETIQQHQ